jgi:hypothetical protein
MVRLEQGKKSLGLAKMLTDVLIGRALGLAAHLKLEQVIDRLAVCFIALFAPPFSVMPSIFLTRAASLKVQVEETSCQRENSGDERSDEGRLNVVAECHFLEPWCRDPSSVLSRL